MSSSYYNRQQKSASVITPTGITTHQDMLQRNRKQIDENLKQEEAKNAVYDDYKKQSELAAQNEKLAQAENEAAQAALDKAFAAQSAAETEASEAAEAYNQALASGDSKAIAAAEVRKNDALTSLNSAQESLASSSEKAAASEQKLNDAKNTSTNLKNNAPPKPTLSKDEIKVAESQVRNAASSKGNALLSQAAMRIRAKESSPSSSNLLDLRSLPSGKNFRYAGNMNAVTDKIVMSPSRSFFLTDYKFADSLTASENFAKEYPSQPIILNEFQPYEAIQPADLLEGLGNMVMEIINGSVGMVAAPIVKGGGKLIQNSLINMYAKDTSKLYTEKGNRGRHMFTSDPVLVVQNMFMGGRWLNTYELPYFGGQYLKAAYSGDWTLGDSSGFLGKGVTGGDDKVGTKMMGIDFPSNPKFKASMSKGREPINLEFYLINTNNEWLKRNFQFLNALYAGSNWLHLKYCFIRPPNVYHVVCPGRFQIYWAAIDVTVTFEGKLRKNKVVSQELRQFSKAISDDMLWPEAWKVKVNIRDLTPNNFNLYAEYYLRGLNTEELANRDGDQMKDLAGTFDDFKKYFDELMADQTIKDTLDNLKKTGKQVADKAGAMVKGLMTSMGGEKEKEKKE